MVDIATIGRCNAGVTSNPYAVGLVCVFAGATNGIGASTLERLTLMLRSPKLYVIGRSAKRFEEHRLKLQSENSTCNIVFLEAEFSLVSDVDSVCEKISAAESKVDLLYMSPGLIPANGATYTNEGLETCFALSYYARMRLTSNLLPLLRHSKRPRVLSVLNGGKEEALREDDIGLEMHWSPLAAVGHTTTMTSLVFDHLAKQDPDIAFLHSYPGWVKTDIFSHLKPPNSASLMRKTVMALIRLVVGTLVSIFGMSPDDCGARQAYYLTGDEYWPGAHRIGYLSEPAGTNKALEKYRAAEWQCRVWDYTLGVFERCLATGSDKTLPKSMT